MYLGDDLQKDDRPVMVSVCCATYNHEEYIERALQGFASQITNFRFEVIVHEDASTDKTREIVNKYVKLYPNIFVPIYQEENQYSQGRGRTFRNMLLKSKGKYIAVCEGDDYWSDEHKLQKQYDILETNEECSICVHDVTLVNVDGSRIDDNNIYNFSLRSGIIEKEQIAEILWKEGKCPFHTSSFFIRRNVLQPRIDYTEPFLKNMNGDMIMMRLCLMHGKFYYVDEAMSCRRRGVNGSWNERWKLKSIAEKVAYYKEFADAEKLYDIYSKYEFHEYIKFYIFTLVSECCVYDTKDVRKYIKEYPLNHSIIKNKATLWLYIRYVIMVISPRMYKFLCSIQRRLS